MSVEWLLRNPSAPLPSLDQQRSDVSVLSDWATSRFDMGELLESYRFPDRLYGVATPATEELDALMEGIFMDPCANIWWGPTAHAEALYERLGQAWQAGVTEEDEEGGGLIGWWDDGDHAWVATLFGCDHIGRFDAITGENQPGLVQVAFDQYGPHAADVWGQYVGQHWPQPSTVSQEEKQRFMAALRGLVVPDLHPHLKEIGEEAGL